MALGQWLISPTFGACGLAVRHRDDAKYMLRDKYIERSGTSAVSRRSVIIKFAVVCAATLAVGGCKNSAQVFEDQNDGGWFAQPLDLFGKPDWARPSKASVSLAPKGPVSAEQLVSADGRCASPPAATAQASEPAAAPVQPPAPADRAVGSVAGDLAGAPMPAAAPAAAPPNPGLDRLEPSATPQVTGGIALGMTECQAVERAGLANNVAIGAGDKGERKVVLTYLSGPWPGIYTFADGRLKVIDRAPEQPKPAKSAPKKTPKKKTGVPKTASHEIERNYVQ